MSCFYKVVYLLWLSLLLSCSRKRLNSLVDPSEDFLEGIAKATLLPSNEVLFFIDHLRTIQTNCKRCAEKAAATRRMKKSRDLPPVRCVCGEEYAKHTDEVQQWHMRFHCHCVDPIPFQKILFV